LTADALNPFLRIETHGNSPETSWKLFETFGRLFPFAQLSRRNLRPNRSRSLRRKG
jgi:hypothetical protein